MLSIAIGLISVLTYVIASILIARETLLGKQTHNTPLKAAWLAAVLHIIFSVYKINQINDIDFSFFSTASLVMLVIVFVLLSAALSKPVAKLGLVIFPLAACILAIHIGYPAKPHQLLNLNWELSAHILSSILSFSLLSIAALQAMLLTILDRQLRQHYSNRFMLALPPLQAMESLLFQLIAIGWLLLTVSLVTGFFFIDDFFAQHLAHKTTLSILAWMIFSALLYGRLHYGWRGQSAVKWTLIGFTSLLLAYFGSKLVLELILKKI